MRVLAISGSLRHDSNSTALLRALREEAPGGVDVELWGGLKEIPPYDADDDVVTGPAKVEAFRSLVREVDAVFFATPEYNSSVPGALKNALDWASRPFPENVLNQKPSLVIGASTGLFGAVWAQAEVRKTLAASGAIVLDTELAVAAADGAFRADASLADPRLRTRLRALLGDLIREVARREAECQAA
jgi:chromate reductase